MASQSDNVNEYASLGWMYQQAGNLPQAEHIFRQLLNADPNNREALFLLGMIENQRGNPVEGAKMLRRLLEIDPEHLQGQFQLATALAAQRQFEQATELLTRVAERLPEAPEVHHRLGCVLAERGQLDAAIASIDRAIQYAPPTAVLHEHLARIYLAKGDIEAGVEQFRTAAALADSPEGESNLGAALVHAGKMDEAELVLTAALERWPESADLLHNVGSVLTLRGKPDQAIDLLEKSLALNPEFAAAANTLGAAYQKVGRFDDAFASFERAVALQPKAVDARLNVALCRLLRGDFRRGFEEYEWRWGLAPMRNFPVPLWDGSPLLGKTVLIHAERGLGDTLQFIRYAVQVQHRGGRVVAEVPGPLVELVRQCPGVDRVVAQGEPLPPFQFHAPLLSLPRIFQTELKTIPAPIPYLYASEERVGDWQKKLQSVEGLRIGIAWQGNPNYAEDNDRSIPLSFFERLADVERVTLISLQHGAGVEQLSQWKGDKKPLVFDGLDTESGPFQDTAAILRNIDLLIASDSALVHLAGAMGVPTWVLLPVHPDWRFLLERDDSPWYPTFQLYRQTRYGDWEEVFERVVLALENATSSQTIIPAVTVDLSPAELVDRITSLEVERERKGSDFPSDYDSRHERTYQYLVGRARQIGWSGDIERLSREMRQLHSEMRELRESLGSSQETPLDTDYAERARRYFERDNRRREIMQQINFQLGSRLI